ncbi:MAG: CDP-archaeol synthase [Nanoarchaeota archaeon]
MILSLLYTYLAAGIANMAPVFLKHLSFLDMPIDCGIIIHKKRLFGDHKTWRGFIGGVIAGTIFFLVQVYAAQYGILTSLLLTKDLGFGFLISVGALSGDLLDACIKRRLGIMEGKAFPPVDKIDYIIGAIVLGSGIYLPSWQDVLLLMVMLCTLTILVKYIGWKIGINQVSW